MIIVPNQAAFCSIETHLTYPMISLRQIDAHSFIIPLLKTRILKFFPTCRQLVKVVLQQLVEIFVIYCRHVKMPDATHVTWRNNLFRSEKWYGSKVYHIKKHVLITCDVNTNWVQSNIHEILIKNGAKIFESNTYESSIIYQEAYDKLLIIL